MKQWEVETNHLFYVVYKMPSGQVKSVLERGDFVENRIERLEAAKLTVLKVEKKRET